MPVPSPRSLKKTPFPAPIGAAMWGAAHLGVRRWDRLMADPAKVEAVQLEQMARIVQQNGNSEYGKKHGMGEIRSFNDWTKRVPISDYDSYFPYFERMMQGEQDVLVPGFVKYFGNSAGSSGGGRQKFLPIVEEQIRFQQLASADALNRYLVMKNDRTFPTGYMVGLLPPTVMKRRGPVTVTNNPALMFARLPLVSRPLWIPKGHIRQEEDYGKKLGMIAETYFDYDVHAVSGTTCWFSLLFDKLIEAGASRGLGAGKVGEIWPNLRVLFGGGVAADPYIPVINQHMGREVTLVDTYNATEGGIFACSDHTGDPGMLMIPNRGVFFEFVPLDEYESANPTRVPVWGVKPGVNYVILVSTVSGLSSYRLGDIVRFASVDPLKVEFAGRLAGCLSTTQELTTHVEVQQAMGRALKKYPVITVDYTCGADVGVGQTGKAQYTLYVEFDKGQQPPDLEGFAREFDEGLAAINRVYREHRDGNTAILAAKVVAMPPGTVSQFMEKAGMTSVQTKFPRIVNDAQKEVLRSLLN